MALLYQSKNKTATSLQLENLVDKLNFLAFGPFSFCAAPRASGWEIACFQIIPTGNGFFLKQIGEGLTVITI